MHNFEEWIKKQKFVGRDISPSGECSSIRLLEYPWMLPYVNVDHKVWTDVTTGDGKCPCGVMLSNFTQLQEDIMGLADEYRENNMLPCPEIMDTMDLHFKRHACFTYGTDDKLASFYAATVYYRAGIPKGLHIRREILEKFLRKKGYSMYWLISAERQLIVGSTALPNYKTYSFCAKYREGGAVTWIKE